MGTDVAGTGLPWIEAIASSFEPYPFASFHLESLPELVARNGALIAADLRDVAPVAFRIDDDNSFTWRATNDGIKAVDGDADAANGQLLVLAGSHHYSKHWYAWGEEGGLPILALDTEPGDLTLHYGDAMHTTPPPTGAGAGRRVLYYKFALPRTFDFIPAGCHYNDALFRADPAGRVDTRAATSV
jgi:hypothetical protein